MPNYLKDPKITEALVAMIASILAMITIYLRKLPFKILSSKRNNVIKHDFNNLIRAYQEVQDFTISIGAIRGHAVFYENHGPEKFSVMFEAKGHPCYECVTKCKLFNWANGIPRIAKDWDNKRRVHEFWLVEVVNKTLILDGKVNTVSYLDARKKNDIEQMEIWDETGTFLVKECFVKPKGDHEFITIVFEFCRRFEHLNHVDIRIENLAHRLRKYL